MKTICLYGWNDYTKTWVFIERYEDNGEGRNRMQTMELTMTLLDVKTKREQF